MYRRSRPWDWFGGPATRRLETGTRDAKTDVWMVWLQAISSAVILALDLWLVYSWLLIVPHHIIEIAGYLLALAAIPPAMSVALWIVLRGWGLYCKFILKAADPLWPRRKTLCAVTLLGTFAATLSLTLWDALEWGWWGGIVGKEFPGRTWPLLHYILYGGTCLAIWVGLATAWLRWWAKEIPDPVRPEVERKPALSTAVTGKTLAEVMLGGDSAARETRRQMYEILRPQFEESDDLWTYPEEMGEPGLIQTQ